MNRTYFDIYLAALSRADDPQGTLGDEWVIHPPDPDYGYDETPQNSLTFGAMGVDGVHYVILTIDGEVRDDSPVVYVSPMDSDCYHILAADFLTFLAEGRRAGRRDEPRF